MTAPIDLADLERLLAEATPAPWEDCDCNKLCSVWDPGVDMFRELIAAVREKDAQIAKLREALDDAITCVGLDNSYLPGWALLLAETAPEGERDG